MKGEVLSIEQDPHRVLQEEEVKYFIAKYRPDSGIIEIKSRTSTGL